MSNKVIKGKVNGGNEGYTIEFDGIHRGSERIVDFPVERISLFVDQGYLGLVDLAKKGVFYFSHTNLDYRYFVGSKTLSVIFDGKQI
jgi:hypothetical protein